MESWERRLNAPSRWIDVRLRASLRSLALIVAARPYLWLCLPLMFAMCFAAGIPMLRSESSYHKLWYPQDTAQYRDLEQYWDRFGFDNRTQIVLVRAASGGAYDDAAAGGYGILAQAALQEVLGIQEALVAADLTVKRNGKTTRYDEVCGRAWASDADGDSAPCVLSSLLELWGSSSATLGADSQSGILAKVNDPSGLVTSYGSSIYLPSVVGSTVYASGGGSGGSSSSSSSSSITGAGALQLVFQVDQKYFDADDAHDAARDFEGAFADAAAALQHELREGGGGQQQDLELFYFTASSFQLESDKAIADDQVFVTYAMVLMVFYVSAMLGRCDPVHSKVLLSLSIIVTIMLSLLFAFGMSGFLGYPLTQLSLMSIFILLGVGVDDMFILVDAWDRAAVAVAVELELELELEAKGAEAEAEEAEAVEVEVEAGAAVEVGAVGAEAVEAGLLARRLARTYGEVGPSIMLTSLTDFTAFMIGSTITVPAISGFCKVAGMSVLAVFAIQLTFFGAALVLDERRVRANRLDVCACVALPNHSSSSSSSSSSNSNSNSSSSSSSSSKAQGEEEGRAGGGGGKGGDSSISTSSSKDRGTIVTAIGSRDLSSSSSSSSGGGSAGGGSKKGAIREALANFMKSLAGFVLRPRTAAVVVVLFLGVDLTLGIFAIQRVGTGADWSDFLPKDSHLLEFYDARDNAGFGSVGTLNFVTFKDLDVGSDDDVATLQAMADAARGLDFVVGLDSWFESLQEWVVTSGDGLGAERPFLSRTGRDRRRLLAAWALHSGAAADSAGFGGTRYAQWPAVILRGAAAGEFDGSDDFSLAAGGADYDDSTASRLAGPYLGSADDDDSVDALLASAGLCSAGSSSSSGSDNGCWGSLEELVVTSSRMVALTSLSGISGGGVGQQIKDMHSARGAMKLKGGSASSYDPAVVRKGAERLGCAAVTQSYGWLAREERMLTYTRDTLIKTLAGVLVIALLFLEPWLAVVTVMSVALVNMALFGTMYWPFNISLNVSSFINLVLAIGFAVDYSAHVAEGFMIKGHHLSGPGETLAHPQERMFDTLVELGGSVLNGGLSTLLGVLVMAFSKSTAFTTLFQMFLSMVVFGLAHGLVFLPCLIYLISLAARTFISPPDQAPPEPTKPPVELLVQEHDL